MCYIDIAPSGMMEVEDPIHSLVGLLVDPDEPPVFGSGLERRLSATLAHAQVRHVVTNPSEPVDLARYLIAVANGLASAAQMGAPREYLLRTAEVAVTALLPAERC